MLDIRPILLVIGILLTTLGIAMVIPALVDLASDEADWKVFIVAAGVTTFVGASLTIATWGWRGTLGLQQAFLLTTLSWVMLVVFAALPFVFSDLKLTYTDAFFEAMSGLTTTGSTVITGLDYVPPGILLWRALLQWLGGIGIIVMAVAVLPMLQVGGMQLFRLESSDTSEKILPRATQIAGSIITLYLVLSMLCALCYYLANMNAFDAITHAMTTIATGGFSTKDASLGGFDSSAIETVSIIFMLIGSMPFVLYLQAIRGKPGSFFRDTQVHWFIGTVTTIVSAFTIYLVIANINGGTDAFRHAAFNVISILTGTGYATTDYGLWGGFSVVGFFCLMFIGGCAGSTSCGIKIFRFQVIFQAMRVHVFRMIHPHGVAAPKYNGRTISESVVSSVAAFFFLFFVCFAVLAVFLSFMGLDTLTAFSAAGTAIANVGPGLGDIVGPSGTFAPLPAAAKWLMSFGMLLGRLEIFTVLVLFTPALWRI